MRTMSRPTSLLLAVAASSFALLPGCDDAASDPVAPPKTSPPDAKAAEPGGVSGAAAEPTETPPPHEGALKPTIEMHPAAVQQQAGVFAAANNAFAFDLYGHLRGVPDFAGKNLALSPASIELALAMTAGGAVGPTRDQMTETMGFGGAGVDVDVPSEAAMAHWEAMEKQSLPSHMRPDEPPPALGVRLQLANRIYGERTYGFAPAFIQRTEARFGAPLVAANFVGDAEGERGRINAWVEERTQDKIQDLIPPRGVDEMTRMVLVNAIHFYGAWAKPFDEGATKDAPFYVGGGEPVAVPTMAVTHSVGYSNVDGLVVVDVPYVGGHFTMTIAMPTTGDLADFEADLSAQSWARLTSMALPNRVRLHLPRFKVDPAASVELKSALVALGMPLPFSETEADFSAMADPPNADDRLYISRVFHKAFVAVDEAGTEAAAATAVVMAKRGMMQPPEEVRVDRPFVFAIRERTSDTVLFVGRVLDPRG
jgi:serpin B